MRHLRSRFALALLLLAAAIAGEPAPATIVREGGKNITGAFIVSETVDGVDYVLDRNRTSTATSSLKRGTYLRIDYTRSNDAFYDHGLSLLGRGDHAGAAERFARAARGTAYDWVAESALLRLAEANLALKKPNEALAAIAQLEKQAPRSPRIVEGLYLKGRALAAAGKAAEAQAAFAALGKRTDAGRMAAALSARGLAELMRGQGKLADAAAALLPMVKVLDPINDAREWGAMAVEMAGDLAAGGDAAQAAGWYGQVAWSAAPGPERARALLGMAELKAAGTSTADLIAAFDLACLAAHGVDDAGEIKAEARGLVKRLQGRIDKDPAISDSDKREYRVYAAK